jgi:hypothetical protein
MTRGKNNYKKKNNNYRDKIGKSIGKCRPCPVFVSYTLAFALQLRRKHGKNSVRVAENSPISRWQLSSTHSHTNSTKNNTMTQNGTYITIRTLKLTKNT